MANDDIIVPEAEAGERERKTKRLFINAQGEKTPRAKADSIAGEVTLVGSGDTLRFEFSELTEGMARAAALWGIMTNITNTIGKKGLSTDEMWDAIESRWETIRGGNWTTDSKTGPRDSDVLLAAERYQKERGKEFGENEQAAMRAKLADEKDGGDYRKRLLSNPRFKAHFEAIKAERAAARAAKAQEAVSSSPDADLLDL